MATNSESIFILLKTKTTELIIANGTIISKNRGNAKDVRYQNVKLEAPDSTTNSRNFKLWVKNTTEVKTKVIKIVAITRFLNRYVSKRAIIQFNYLIVKI